MDDTAIFQHHIFRHHSMCTTQQYHSHHHYLNPDSDQADNTAYVFLLLSVSPES